VPQAGRPQVPLPVRSLQCSIDLNLPPHCGPGVDSASKRNEYQKVFLQSNARSARKADNLTAIYEPIV
jgi:hypothetical protein